MRLLVTGGAGYIGSHATHLLLNRGHSVLVLDDLSTGYADAVDPRATLIQGSLHSQEVVKRATQDVDGVLHFAASSQVGESCENPLKYWHNNVGGTVSLLRAMEHNDVRRLLFSSTAATYGQPEDDPIHEGTAQDPINPYGSSKLAIETVIHEYARTDPRFGFAVLRYFNVAGCAWGYGERHDPETHLVPIILQAAAGARTHVSIFGNDYPTPDGTCVRDYVHVKDLVEAHAVVLEALEAGDARTYNIGSGSGCSVQEMMTAAQRVTGVDFEIRPAARREGDPPRLVTNPQKIKRELGWKTRHSSIEEILTDHWAFVQSQQPNES